MKRVLVFNDYYIPAVKCGGPVTSISNAVAALHDDFEFYIEAANHDFGEKKPFNNIGNKWYTVGYAQVRYHRDGELDFNYRKIEKFIKEVKPDLMWFSGLLMPNKLHNAIRIGMKLNIPILISPRGEASPNRMRLKGYKKFPYAFIVTMIGIYKKQNVFFHVTSYDEIDGLYIFFHIEKKQMYKVPNIGVVSRKRDRNYLKKSGNIKIMFLSRIHEVKNLKFAIDVVNRLTCNAEFHIYGPIESKEYWEECLQIAQRHNEKVKIKYCGKVNPEDVGKVYSQYDCFLFPTINENYGHVIAESLANGCPVILSKGTTPWDDLHERAGYVCPLNDKKSFIDALQKIASFNSEEYVRLIETTESYYSSKSKQNDSIDGHRNMFNEIINNYKVKYESNQRV